MSHAADPVVIGAGPVGSLLSLFLARRGLSVEVYERRPDMRVESISAGRSINLALSVRGLYALSQVGLAEEALRQAVAMNGRMMHSVSGELSFQPYGKEDSDCIYSVSRGGLNQLLMSAAEATGRVRFHFNRLAKAYDPATGVLVIDTAAAAAPGAADSGESLSLKPSRIFGTDGSGSVLREAILREAAHEGLATSHSEELLNYGYKELTLPASPQGGFQLKRNALHIWPRGTFMLIALPNFDGSFTCTLFMPFTGERSFATLESPRHVRAFFDREFGDVSRLFPALEGEIFEHPVGKMVTVKCAPWFSRGKAGGQALLMGDAAHAIVPFFGQGMNCGFEDCSILDGLLADPRWAGTSAETGPDWGALFRHFSELRKPDADAIADLAVENFVEMRDKVADPRFLLEKQVERILQREFPAEYVSRYSMVTFSRVPYRQALEAGVMQNELLSELCRELTSVDQLNLGRARELIMERLGKSTAPHDH